ncbi:MAG TPA: chromate efflux transporter [Steroidobacteraceae bacterium]|nr:chromate efflux transporter [Steroidobacteraceae bacterium]
MSKQHAPRSVTFGEATRTWLRVGLLSFGGPAGQIAVMHRILVEEKRWISEQRFLHALSYCMLLPGPEAQQLATYIGWLLHGLRGGLVAGVLFVLPGLLAIMGLSFVYVLWHQHPLLTGVFLGLKVAVIALVVEAVVRVGRRALRAPATRWIAIAAFVAIAALRVPFPLIVLGAGLLGYLLVRAGSKGFAAPAHAAVADAAALPVVDASAVRQAEPTAGRALRMLAVWLPLWFAPVLLCVLLAGSSHVFAQLGFFFSKMAVVTFGGAYAVLSYVAQQAVERYAWITPGQMLDGLGLAESTPGPLIMVVQFVGFLAAYQAGGSDYPLLAGVLGALITVWVTFVPCFLWIFVGAPYVEKLRGNQALGSALAAITAAVVGVIANLALWFATHVLFERVSGAGWPELASLRFVPAALTAAALVLQFGLKWPLWRTLLLCATLGAATSLLPAAATAV